MKKILLISGHGAGDSGACSTIDGKLYKEATETRNMTKLIKKALKDYKCNVEIYPTSRNAYEDAKAGKLQCNFTDYDYVLEIHFNACVNDIKGNGRTTGVEAYVTTYDTTKATETCILSKMSTIGLKNRGVKSHNWTVINRAKTKGVDSCLLEVCFIDDADDMRIYIEHQSEIALLIAQGVINGLAIPKKNSLSVGDKVKIKAGAKDLNTKKKYSEFVYGTVYTVIRIDKDAVVFGLSGKTTGKTKTSNIIKI
jgi:N-acetylmuramoyl-L-alanine amidase